MVRRRGSLIASVLAWSLATAQQVGAQPSIEGEWVWGYGSTPGRVPVHYSEFCGRRAAKVHVVERGGAVEATVEEATPMTGGARSRPPPFTTVVEEKLRGTFDGRVLRLTGSHDVIHRLDTRHDPDDLDVPRGDVRVPADTHEPVLVELRLTPGHRFFVGERNGVRIWLARGKRVPTTTRACPP